MGLSTYAKKRNFDKTREPAPKVRRRKGHTFVVQKHAASHLHYDFRLEVDGVLKSWAVPKGPSRNPNDKRLAVQVEDHPLDYGTFEGTIPKGQYGGGSVIVWDAGTWEAEGEIADGLQRGKLTFELKGKKLRGGWTLVRMGRGGKNWLLTKRDDHEADTQGDIVEDQPRSVLSQQTVESIGHRSTKPLPHLPDVSPQLATLVSGVPPGDDWLFEIKFDGYRAMAYVAGSKTRMLSRNGHDWSDKFAPLVEATQALPCSQAILDGEVVVLKPDGSSDFQLLQNALSTGDQDALHYYIFDLLFLDGEDLREVPLTQRKKLLLQLMQGCRKDGVLHFSDHMQDNGKQMFEHACKHGLEGIIAKRADSPHSGKRSNDWLKVKCTQRQEFVVGGFTAPTGSRTGIGALLLGTYNADKELIYAGRVGTGFNAASLQDLYKRLAPLARPTPAFESKPKGLGSTTWVAPKLVVEVAFSNWTREGHLRHPSYQGMRGDKKPQQVMREKAVAPKAPPKATKKRVKKAPAAGQALKNVVITHPDRVVYPDVGLTKQDVATYFATVAPRMLPHIAGRPLTLVRCPEGCGKKCFFQRHIQTRHPQYVHGVSTDADKDDYPYVDTAEGLIALVQNGILEMHTWGCRAADVERPDCIIFDLDPAPDVKAAQLIAAALKVRSVLEELSLEAFVKRTGGKGLHVVVPLAPRAGWEVVKTFAQRVSARIEAEEPRLYTTNMSKARRNGKVFLDYFRNGRSSTSVAPYSTRATDGAPVALPVHWDSLTPKFLARPCGIAEALAALNESDPWSDYFSVKQELRP